MDLEHALSHREELYRVLVETCADGIVLTDLSGTIHLANTAAANLHGFDHKDKLVGSNIFQVVSPDDVDRMEQTIQEVLTVGQVRHIEHRLLRRDTAFSADVNLSVVRDEQRVPLALVGVIRDMTERQTLEDALRYQALHDSLTGLPNRTLLYDRLEHALLTAQRDKTAVALLLLDLDGFKEVNDQFGHDYGDALLEHTAGRLQSVLRGADTVARLGGDEFAVVLSGDEGGAREVAHKLRDVVATPLTLNEATVRIDVSIGIARYPGDGHDYATLLRHADSAMYAAKRTGPGRVVSFQGSDDVSG